MIIFGDRSPKIPGAWDFRGSIRENQLNQQFWAITQRKSRAQRIFGDLSLKVSFQGAFKKRALNILYFALGFSGIDP